MKIPPTPPLSPALLQRGCLLTLLFLVLLSACGQAPQGGGVATPTHTPRNATASPTSGSGTGVADGSRVVPEAAPNTLAAVLTTPTQRRDLYGLTERLKHSKGRIPHVVNARNPDYPVGRVDTFNVANNDAKNYFQIQATLVYKTAHVYMYVQQGVTYDVTAVQASADLFENKTYPTDRLYFGSEANPGIDNDPHITILNATGLGAGIGGYYSSEDEYPRVVNSFSNEREMIYINLSSFLQPGGEDYNSTLAHEFQHMIHWNQHPIDDAWENEGSSVLAQHLNGFSSGGFENTFAARPDTQLTGWASNPQGALPHYGAGYLFMDYFVEHYGGPNMLRQLLLDPAPAPLNFDHVLKKNGYSDSFADVYRKWLIANYLNDSTVDKGQYSYKTIGVHITAATQVQDFPSVYTDSVHPYGAQYYEVRPNGQHPLSISFRGASTVNVVGNTPRGSRFEWWSNRGDNIMTNLTRPFDLTKVTTASLSFWTWYDIEKDFDYAYVEVSTDNGQNWTTLAGQNTTNTNPNGANFSNGLTGVSSSPAGTGPNPQWVQEHMNLTPWAGKKILVRFEYVTDDEYTGQSLTLDGIEIPEIHFKDDVTSDNGWVSSGFIRSDNTLPEQYIVQLVEFGDQVKVTQIPLTLDHGAIAGQVTLPTFGKDITKATVIVTALAPKTTLSTNYTLKFSV